VALHLAEQIMASISTTITGLTTTGNNVERGRVYPFDESITDALTLTMGPDEPLDVEFQTYPYLDCELTIYIDAHCKNVITQIDSQLNIIRTEFEIAIMADHTQSALVIDSKWIGSDVPELSGEGDQITGVQRTGFQFHYRRLRNDPSIGG